MSPPQYERVVADCDDALRQDPNYVKALNRRATALESLSRYEGALRGLYRITACSKVVGVGFSSLQISPPRQFSKSSKTRRLHKL